MTEQELERLLSIRTPDCGRDNATLVLATGITRSAARLKKRRRDRLQLAMCIAAACVFAAGAAAVMLMLTHAESPEALLRQTGIFALGGMGLTLLLAPALAWFSDEERKNEA